MSSPNTSPGHLAARIVDSLYIDESPPSERQANFPNNGPRAERRYFSNPFHTPSRRASFLNNTNVYQDIWRNANSSNPPTSPGGKHSMPCNFSNRSTAVTSAAVPFRVPPTRIDTPDNSAAMDVVYPMRNYNDNLNYRKLLEKHVSCDWKVCAHSTYCRGDTNQLIVKRIILNNDQQASIFLQQKLKTASAEQKNGIINATIEQSFKLMINRFGNFLIQRCFEYGTPEQIKDLTKDMKGKVCQLSTDPFGCHAIQKAIDCVTAETKTMIIEEMLLQIKETISHRHACHVWQKLFELQQESTPLTFMTRLNQELTGFWVNIAQGETGSLVVQNIFENCNDKDKLPCVLEIVGNLDTVIKGQWGNWVIQHMVEHASEPYRQIVIDKVIENCPVYSTDQVASKAVEKMLKMGDPAIIQAFLDKVTVRSPGRTRIPLVDIASDANGNFLVQYILQSGSAAQKDKVIAELKKHMVSLRGSKWGSKCALLIDRHRTIRRAS